MEIHNHDIKGIVARLDRFSQEIRASQSALTSELGSPDRERLDSYLAALKTYKAWVISQPKLDLPESAPQSYIVADSGPVGAEDVENEHLKDIMIMLGLTRIELIKSQSAELGSGLIGFDGNRFDKIIEKVEKFLTDYVDASTPLDLPESSPLV